MLPPEVFFATVNAEPCLSKLSHKVFKNNTRLDGALSLQWRERPSERGLDERNEAQSYIQATQIGKRETVERNNPILNVDSLLQILRLLSSGGKAFWNATIIEALRGKNGNVTGWVVVLQTYYKNGRFI